MKEVLPVVAGAAVGAALARRRTWVAVLALSMVIGLGAAAVAGELALSWGFALVDTVQALIAAALVRGLVRALRRRSARPR
jgi:uncharacterized membrane protein